MGLATLQKQQHGRAQHASQHANYIAHDMAAASLPNTPQQQLMPITCLPLHAEQHSEAGRSTTTCCPFIPPFPTPLAVACPSCLFYCMAPPFLPCICDILPVSMRWACACMLPLLLLCPIHTHPHPRLCHCTTVPLHPA